MALPLEPGMRHDFGPFRRAWAQHRADPLVLVWHMGLDMGGARWYLLGSIASLALEVISSGRGCNSLTDAPL
jgi:hypothetical protein